MASPGNYPLKPGAAYASRTGHSPSVVYKSSPIAPQYNTSTYTAYPTTAPAAVYHSVTTTAPSPALAPMFNNRSTVPAYYDTKRLDHSAHAKSHTDRRKRPGKSKGKHDRVRFWPSSTNQLSSLLPTVWFGDCQKKRRKSKRAFPRNYYSQYGDVMYPADVDDSNDWDKLRGAPTPRGYRRGPDPETPLIPDLTLQDLFPCLKDVFDACGCNKKKERMHVAPRNVGGHKHPQLETVCLECGYVLNKQNLAKSVMRDAACHSPWPANANQQSKHASEYEMYRTARNNGLTIPSSKFKFGYGATPRDWEEDETYDGYQGWTYDDAYGTAADGSVDGYRNGRYRSSDQKVPLPHFDVKEPRKFRHRPGENGRAGGAYANSDYFDVDESGVVTLPQFGRP